MGLLNIMLVSIIVFLNRHENQQRLLKRLQEDVRYGGDEFVLVLFGITCDQVKHFLEDILQKLNHQSDLYTVSFAYGVEMVSVKQSDAKSTYVKRH